MEIVYDGSQSSCIDDGKSEHILHTALEDEVLASPKTWLVWVAAGITLISGTVGVWAVKLQCRSYSPPCAGCEPTHFNQPYWHTFIMFTGESLCLIVWVVEMRIRDFRGRKLMTMEFPRTLESFNKPRTPSWWWAYPAVLDLLGTSFVNMAYQMSYASTVQLLRNTMLIFTSMFSMMMMKRPLRVHEWAGIVVMIIGMAIASLHALVVPEVDTDTTSDRAWLGIVLAIVGTVFNACQIILEEWYLARAYFPPMGAVGLQGLYGLLMNTVALAVVHRAGWYHFDHAWYQIEHAPHVRMGTFCYLITTCIFNGAAICVTKLGSGMLRAVIYSLRAPCMWLVEIFLKWQTFSWTQVQALVLGAVGFLLYAFVFPGISVKRTPHLYRYLRAQIPCFCTHPIPQSDVEDFEVCSGDSIGKSDRGGYAMSNA